MAQQRCYYDVLNVERTATKVVIDRAYRKLAIKYHPDSNGGDEEAIAKFKECSEAYEVLSDSNKRARYDQFGHAGAGPGADGASPFGGVDDLFDVVSDIFGGGFGGAGGGGRRRRRVRKGNDVRSNVTLTLEEAASGATKEVSFRRRMPCDRCDGSGAAPGSDPVKCSTCGGHGQVIQQAGILRMQTTCPSCGGAGSVVENPCGHCAGSGLDSERVTLSIDIPAGVDDGMRVLASGEGEPSPDGDGPPGDCYCFVTVRPHSLFEREGTNL
ncbi:MAG: DnaJ domain-containing protein, partial [Planctomycetota bacterium]